MGFLSDLGDKWNIGDGTSKCKKRARAYGVGDPGKIQFGENLCTGSNPGQYQTSADFDRAYKESNSGLFDTTQTEEEREEALKKRNQAFAIGGLALLAIVLFILSWRWINN